MPEAWKVMLAVAFLLVLFAVLSYFELSEPAEIAMALLLGSFFAITTWIGFRIGRKIEFHDQE